MVDKVQYNPKQLSKQVAFAAAEIHGRTGKGKSEVTLWCKINRRPVECRFVVTTKDQLSIKYNDVCCRVN